MKFIIFIMLYVAVNANAQDVLSESAKDLGGGFKEIDRAENLSNIPGSFEGIGHFSYFYYRDIQLSQTNTFSISPSYAYALYQDGPTGRIFLYNPKEEKSVVLVDKFRALVKGIQWYEDSSVVYVTFYEYDKTLLIKLND